MPAMTPYNNSGFALTEANDFPASSRDLYPTTVNAASANNPVNTLPYRTGFETSNENQYLPPNYPFQTTSVYAANPHVGCQIDGFASMNHQSTVPPQDDSVSSISSAYPSSSYYISPHESPLENYFPPAIPSDDDDVSCAGSVCSCTCAGRGMNPQEDYNMTRDALKVNSDMFSCMSWMSKQLSEQCCYVVHNLQLLTSQMKKMQEDQHQLAQMIAEGRACNDCDSQSSDVLRTQSIEDYYARRLEH